MEPIGAGHVRGQPNRARLGLADLFPVSLGDQRRGDPECFLSLVVRTLALLTPDQIQPRNNIAVLITARDLQRAIVLSEQMQEVVTLQNHVRELGVGNALLTILQSVAHRVLLDHLIDAEVLADIPEHVEVRHRFQPVQIVDQGGGIGSVKIQQTLKDLSLRGHVLRHVITGAELTLGIFPRGISDQTSAPTKKNHRPVTRFLKMAEQHDRDEVPNGQRVAGGIKPAVAHATRCGQMI